MTEEQVTKVYNTIKDESLKDEKIIKLETVRNEQLEENKLEPMNGKAIISPLFNEDELREAGLDDETIESLRDIHIDEKDLEIDEAKASYDEVFSQYDISTEDGIKLFDLINKFKNGEDINYYNECPEKIQYIIDGLRVTGEGKIGRNAAAKVLLDSFINDAKFNAAVDQYTEEMSELMLDTNKTFGEMFSSSINELYSDEFLERLKTEDPESIAKVENMKNIFKESRLFKAQLNYLDKISIKKLKKAKYESECAYFNKKMNNNTFNIKVPKIETLYPIIKKARAGFTEAQIKLFIITICKSCYSVDPNNIEELALVYRMISGITAYEHSVSFEDEDADELFENISNVIRKIINL